MIHDKRDDPRWTELVDWEEEYDHNDVVIHSDPQKLLGEDTVAVSRITHNNDFESVQRLGLFWRGSEAVRYAKAFAGDVAESRRSIEEALGE